jgi:phage terminase Nu1 subunit (DNA packaging protein)
MNFLASPDVVCTRQQLSEVLGLTTRTVDRLALDGLFKPVRGKFNGSGKRYRLSVSVQAYLKHRSEVIKKQCDNGAGDAYNNARARRMEALAAKEELSLAAQQGLYHRADDIEFFMTQMLTAAKQRLMAIPSRVMHRLVGVTDARKINQIVDDDIRLALTELSESKFKDSLEFKNAQRRYLQSKGIDPDIAEDEERNGE